MCALLRPNFSVNFCFLPEGEDPDTFLKANPPATFQSLLNNVQSLLDTLWQGYVTKLNVTPHSSPEVKTQFKKSIFEHVNQITDADLKHFFKQDIDDKLYNLFVKAARQAQYTSKQNTSGGAIVSFTGKPYQGQMPQTTGTTVPLSTLIHKKNNTPAKILLATLKNNPILLSDTYEMLIQIDDLPEDLSQFRDYLCEHQFESFEALLCSANDHGFMHVLNQLETIDFPTHLPFMHPNDDPQNTLNIWTEIWSAHYMTLRLNADTAQIKQELVGSTDEEVWEQWKTIKMSNLTET